MSSIAATRCFVRTTGGRVSHPAMRRRPLVVHASEAEQTRAQDTVGDLKREQIDRALEIQLTRSEETKAPMKSPAPEELLQQSPPAATAEEPAADVAIPPKISAKAQVRKDAEEAARSQSVLAETRDRAGLLDTAAESAALHRQYGAKGGGEADAGGVSAENLDTPAGAEQSVGGKFEPSEMYDDGSFLYTAAMLEAVNYEEARTS